jgi:hypothetical protein
MARIIEASFADVLPRITVKDFSIKLEIPDDLKDIPLGVVVEAS